MGSILIAICTNCAYETDELHYGGGFINYITNCAFPGIDKEKNVISTGNIMEKKDFKKQKPGFIFYDDKSLYDKKIQKREKYHNWGEYKVYHNGYLCPKCRKFCIEFHDVGCWD